MSHKFVFLFVGVGGGVGKTFLACNLADWLRYRCSPDIRVRGFDLDPQRGLSRFSGRAAGAADFNPREILGSIVDDPVHSCFLIDAPGGSRELLEDMFRGYPVSALAFEGVRVILVVPVGGDTASFKGLPFWMELGGSGLVWVYRAPVMEKGRQIVDSAQLADVPLPLWLELARGRAGRGDFLGEWGIERMIQPQFKPKELVEHLFRHGISLYQAAYPYSRWAGAELGEEEMFRRRQAINRLVGEYWISRKQYEGVGYQYGYQLSFWLDLLYGEFETVFEPLFVKSGLRVTSKV